MKRYAYLLVLFLLLAACSSNETDTMEEAIGRSPATTTTETAPDGAAPAWLRKSKLGGHRRRGQRANRQLLHVGWQRFNQHLDYRRCGNGRTGTIRHHPQHGSVSDATEYINKVLGEKEAGRDTDGAVDLVWINGENFRTMRQGDLLYGSWSQFLPNSAYVNWDDASVANDFGFSVDGYEAPYGKAQFVMVYDSAKVAEPPRTIEDLLAWIQDNPGKFTYPAPPDFTGSAFVRHICYWAAGGYDALLGEFDQALFDEKLPACWQTLNDIEPSLWREGQTYPENHTRQQDLFANGEVYFDMAYNPAEASSLVENGRYPETTRTFVFDTGTIANTHYVAIPYNSPNKAAAMVVANYLLSPEAQLSKAQPEKWGDLPVLDPTLLPAEWQAQFAAIPRGVATLSTEELAANSLPELQAPWLTAIEQAWTSEVLQR
ncbi:MAG: ABC transporter substrate-binding protein [Chloroflexota bacterium]